MTENILIRLKVLSTAGGHGASKSGIDGNECSKTQFSSSVNSDFARALGVTAAKGYVQREWTRRQATGMTSEHS